MRKSSIAVSVGVILILAGTAGFVLASINLSNQIDRVDLEGTSGNLFEFGIAPLGALGLLALIGGILVLMVPHRPSPGRLRP